MSKDVWRKLSTSKSLTGINKDSNYFAAYSRRAEEVFRGCTVFVTEWV